MKFGELWKNVEISWYFKGPALSAFFYETKLTSLNGLKFHMHVSDDDSNMFCKFDEIWWTLKKCWNFMIFQRAGTVSIFLWNKSTSLNGLKFHMHVSDDDSNKFCKFDEIWWTLKKCWNFMIFQRAGTVSIFLWTKLTSLNGLKFHMHVSDDDSNMFCKFDEIWWTLKKCWNFMIFLGPALWKEITSLNGLKFHMHVSDDDSNKFCKFDEIWWTLKKCWNFMIFQRAGTVSIFLWTKLTSLNGLKFHMHVSDDDSNMFCKFDEIWWTLKKCWNFMIFLGPALW